MLPQWMLAIADTATPASSRRIPPRGKRNSPFETDILVHCIVTHRAQASFEHGTTARQKLYLSTAIRQLLIGRARRIASPPQPSILTRRSMEPGSDINAGGRVGTFFPQGNNARLPTTARKHQAGRRSAPGRSSDICSQPLPSRSTGRALQWTRKVQASATGFSRRPFKCITTTD